MDDLIIREKDFQKARNKIRESKGKTPVIFSSQDDILNRKVLEKEPIDILLLSQKGKRDRIKQRDSGFNHVLAKIAKKKNISVGINLDEIQQSKGKEKADILARVRQNVKLCNKNKLKMKFISGKNQNSYNLKALGIVLGMPTGMAKNIYNEYRKNTGKSES